ncbi:hypothetical protein BN1221_00722 [Brenneria goodwinii]|uniref:Uncharacterized protein n=1 Tax=Brenneria goodwinii TaxID=1109412 RepID=A0A0G4JQV5_9GAMM|nr:hypothetical protein BN1221_00722 [Brenneria goodwinii]
MARFWRRTDVMNVILSVLSRKHQRVFSPADIVPSEATESPGNLLRFYPSHGEDGLAARSRK